MVQLFMTEFMPPNIDEWFNYPSESDDLIQGDILEGEKIGLYNESKDEGSPFYAVLTKDCDLSRTQGKRDSTKDRLITLLPLVVFPRLLHHCSNEFSKQFREFLSSSCLFPKIVLTGTLLVDLSEGRDLESSVHSFEVKVAPTNYKRPTSLVTQSMIDSAKEKVEELGLTTALERRFAVLEDISINNVLFADRTAKKRMNSVFDKLYDSVQRSPQSFDKVEEVSIDNFITNILPKAESIDVMFENSHSSNLVSLIAPADLTAKGLFKWANSFSWSYAGELTDSIKERVKNAGGKVDGDLRCSLSWFNYDDLDLHMIEPDGTHIYFRQKRSHTNGCLDVDMNAGGGKTREAVENICYPTKHLMIEGVYKLFVNQFSKRESIDVGFNVEVEFDGKIFSFSYAKPVRDSEMVAVADIKYTHKDGFEIIKSLPNSQSSKEIWGITTQTFHRVSVIMLSPNYWDEKVVGNKHYFFILESCVNDGRARGFFNEFLKEDLNIHRKVFEVVGSKMKLAESPNQLSGIGFSSTQRNKLVCKINGTFSRTVKVIF